MEKQKKKNFNLTQILVIAAVSMGGITLFLYKRNSELVGTIKNQGDQISGLIKEVKNLSYHLGKKTLFKH